MEINNKEVKIESNTDYETVDSQRLYSSNFSFFIDNVEIDNSVSAQYDCGDSYSFFDDDFVTAEKIANKYFCDVLSLNKRKFGDSDYDYSSNDAKEYDKLLDLLNNALADAEPKISKKELSKIAVGLEDYKEEEILFGVSLNSQDVVKLKNGEAVAVAILDFNVNTNNYTYTAAKFFNDGVEYKEWLNEIYENPFHCNYQDANLVARAIDSI